MCEPGQAILVRARVEAVIYEKDKITYKIRPLSKTFLQYMVVEDSDIEGTLKLPEKGGKDGTDDARVV